MDLIKAFLDVVLHLQDHLYRLTSDHGAWVYGILFLIIFAETGLVLTPVLPGDSLLFAVGAVAANPASGLNVWVAGALMIEPTESESKEELDRFIEAMTRIRAEIADIESGKSDKLDNPLKNAPHTVAHVTASEWTHKYTREEAAYPAPWLRDFKFWPSVGRVDNPYGDRNLVCACEPMSAYR